MNWKNLSQAYDADGVKIMTYKEQQWDYAALAARLLTLSTDHAPQGCDGIISFNEPHKWGRVIFHHGGLLAKAIYTYRFDDRREPFVDPGNLFHNWYHCAGYGLPIPAFKGIFSVQQNDEWMWNGVVCEYLDGWRELKPYDGEDHELMRLAVQLFAAKGVCNNDNHVKNIMTDGNGGYKVVDLDNLTFGMSAEEAIAKMLEYAQQHPDGK